MCIHEYFRLVLCWEVVLFRSVLYRRFHCRALENNQLYGIYDFVGTYLKIIPTRPIIICVTRKVKVSTLTTKVCLGKQFSHSCWGGESLFTFLTVVLHPVALFGWGTGGREGGVD